MGIAAVRKRSTHKMRRLDKVWMEGRKPQPNGYISWINWEDGEVEVTFLSDPRTKDTFERDLFWGKWTDKFGGCYYIEDGEW